jgi:BlaI family transcriptional regulator, penicillinase repressor
MKTLTRAEEQVMKVLWEMGDGLLMEIVGNMPPPQPHKNTVATILKTLVEKQFVRIEPIGRIHRYFPLMSRDDYSKASLTNMVKGYFGGSFSNVVSFMVDEDKLSVEDLELLLKQLKKK